MGWFWGSSNDDKGTDNDPLRNLEPSLRDFLKKESPIKYKSSPLQPSPPQLSSSHSTSPSISSNETSNPSSSEEKDSKKKTLPLVFKDGRYSHLWESYQSPEVVDSYMKSDQEKIDEILEGFKIRRAEIGKAALENCALEQEALSDCWTRGSAKSRLMLCREENKAFNRCHTMQSKFLKALGYLSSFDRPVEVDEEIQMRADTLYHRMLDEEKKIEEARAEGKPTPKFSPLLSQEISSSPLKPETKAAQKDVDQASRLPSDLKESVRKQLKERLEKLTPIEKEVEEQAIKAEIRAGESLGGNLTDVYEKQEHDRQVRREQGKETIGDKVISAFGFGLSKK
ncbi:putative autophagy protein [Golovinomyces cichoracearum]|uniref:Putative autophagy protein n=1 Tax=Golovinomyces cichoracearum TaxID=62708 RepID=A0A420IK91_9PEZI|nr:putative autophagy protein [Golovinomyces cichoracearum]